MTRHALLASLAALIAVDLVAPAAAVAADGSIPEVVSLGIGALGLIVAAVLLVEILLLKKLARGGVITRNMTLVVLAVLCLTSAALVGWMSRFLDVGFDAQQVRLSAEALVIVAMVLLGIYFASVRRAMRSYVEWLTGLDHLRDSGAFADDDDYDDELSEPGLDASDPSGGVPGV